MEYFPVASVTLAFSVEVPAQAILFPVCSPPALDLLEVNEEFEDLEADTQAEGREEGGH